MKQMRERERMSAADGRDGDTLRREDTPKPHPDDWPQDISEPDFLELTQVYSGDETRRGGAAAASPQRTEPGPEHPVPGDEMQPYYIAEESPHEVIFAPDLSGDEAAHTREDFIAEPEADDTARERVREPDDAEPPPDARVEPAPGDEAADMAQPDGPHRDAYAEAGPTIEEFDQVYPAEKARQGRIVLDQPEKRALFLGGLVGTAIVALAMFLMEMV